MRDSDWKFGHSEARATPEYIRSVGPPITSAITTGNIGRLASAAEEARKMFEEFDEQLAKLSERLAELEREKPVAPRAVREA